MAVQIDPRLIELAITKALMGQGDTLDAAKLSEDFVARYAVEDEIKKLHLRLDKKRGNIATGNTFETTVVSDLAAARSEFEGWRNKRNAALAKDKATWNAVIGTFVGAAALAMAPGSGGVSVMTVLPLITSLISGVSAATS